MRAGRSRLAVRRRRHLRVQAAGTAMFGQLVGHSDTTWTVHQHNPAANFSLKRSEWPVCYRVPGIWLSNVNVHLTSGLPMGTAKDLDTAKAEFKAAWEALKARTRAGGFRGGLQRLTGT